MPHTKASAKKGPAKKASAANQSICTVTLPLTQEVFYYLIGNFGTDQELVVVFEDESNTLEVKALEEGNNKMMKEIDQKNLSTCLNAKSVAPDNGRKFQAYILVGDKAYSGASQQTMLLAIAFIYWAIKVGASANYRFPGLSTHSNPFPLFTAESG